MGSESRRMNSHKLRIISVILYFFLWVHTHNPLQGLKKQVICIFCINVVAFGIVFYSQCVLRPCVINVYVVKKLRKLSWLYDNKKGKLNRGEHNRGGIREKII